MRLTIIVGPSSGLRFNYGRSYLEREDAIPIYLPELPLRSGVLPLLPGLPMPRLAGDASLGELLASAARVAPVTLTIIGSNFDAIEYVRKVRS